MEGRSVPVFADSDWRATEELALLEAVELYGFGNWEDTAALVGRRSADEVRRHFITFYVKGSVGRVTWSHASPETYQALDHTCSRDGNLSPSLTTPLPAIPELSLLEQQHLGYMPKRDDFEREFDNEVEMLISTLRINPNDEEDLDVDLKVAHIDMYNRRLRQRFRKKAVVRDYGLVSQFYKSLTGDPEIMSLIHPESPPLPSSSAATSLVSERTAVSSSGAGLVTGDSVSSPSASHSGRLQSISPSSPNASSGLKSHSSSPLIPSSPCLTPNRINGLTSPAKKQRSTLSPGKSATSPPDYLTAERFHEQLRDRFKIFSQFQSALDQKQLLDNLKRERELKLRIKELIRYRKSGIRKLSEVAGLETARSDRDKRKENKKKGGSTVCDRKSLARDTATARGKGCNPGARAETVTCTTTSSMESGKETSGSPILISKNASSCRTASPASEAVSCKSDPCSGQRKGGREESPEVHSGSNPSKGLKEFDINSMPSARLLNAQEKKVCSSLRLTPSQYMNIKGLMLAGKSLPKKQKSGLENLDSRIKRRLQGFFKRSGWIKA